MKKIILPILLLSTVALVGCSPAISPSESPTTSVNLPSEPEPTTSVNPEDMVYYRFTITTTGGSPISDVTINVEGVESKVTDYKGKAVFHAPKGNYNVTLINLPLGYIANDSYSINDTEYNYTFELNSEVIDAPRPENTIYEKGDLIHNVVFEDNYGETQNLKETLKTKDLVFINLWATWCGPCVNEFAHIEKAYKKLSDRLEIFALNTEPDDTMQTVKDFAIDHELSFKFGKDLTNLYYTLNTPYIPASCLVNKQGIIVDIAIGGFTSESSFTNFINKHL